MHREISTNFVHMLLIREQTPWGGKRWRRIISFSKSLKLIFDWGDKNNRKTTRSGLFFGVSLSLFLQLTLSSLDTVV